MAEVRLCRANKVFPNGVHAVQDLDLTVHEGQRVAIVGPSGSGKSTTLRLIAGLESLTSGDVRFQGKSVKHVSPVERNVAMVFQQDALYPHLTVEQNIAFSLRMRRVDKSIVAERVQDAVALLDIKPLLSRFPSELSGGQRQRVAVGRAIVRQPQVFLLDEPLSSLDTQLRIQMRSEIVELQSRLATTMIYVTHDQQEAMTIGDRLVVVRDGMIQQDGSPTRVYERPANRFVAGFIGSPAMNFLEGQISDGQFCCGDQRLAIVSAASDGPVILGVRPEKVILLRESDAGMLSGRVKAVEFLGHELLVHLEVGRQVWTARAETLNASVGDAISLSIQSSDMHLFQARGSQMRLEP